MASRRASGILLTPLGSRANIQIPISLAGQLNTDLSAIDGTEISRAQARERRT